LDKAPEVRRTGHRDLNGLVDGRSVLSTDVHAKQTAWKVQAECVLLVIEVHRPHDGWQVSSRAHLHVETSAFINGQTDATVNISPPAWGGGTLCVCERGSGSIGMDTGAALRR
jgi:hypothetical protein